MKSIKAALKRKSQKDRRQLGDRSAAVCCLGEGRGAALPPWPCWWHTRSLRRALPPPHLPPFWLPTQPGNPWEHLKPRLGAGPILPTQRLMTIPLTPTISHILSTKHSFFSLSLSLYFPLPTIPSQNCQDLYALWEYLECEREKFPSFSQNWFFMCITSSQHANVSDVP